MGNKLSSLEEPLLNNSIKSEEKQKEAFDKEEKKKEAFDKENKIEAYRKEQREAFHIMINEKDNILCQEGVLINKEIRKIILKQLSEGGNTVITDKVLLERFVNYYEELIKIENLRKRYVYNNNGFFYEDKLFCRFLL